MSPLQIAYDISELGVSNSSEPARRGIYRVVENVCHALLNGQGDYHVSLTAVEAASSTERYLAGTAAKTAGPAQRELRARPLHLWWTGVRDRSQLFAKDTTNRAAARRVTRWVLARSLRWQDKVTRVLPAFDPEAFDVFHSPAQIPIPHYLRSARRPACFLTIYDLIPFHYPALAAVSAPPLRRALASLGPSEFAICISQYVKDDVCEYLHLDPTHVFVAPLAADAGRFHPCGDAERLAAVRRRYELPDNSPYLLSLCALEPRKNIPHLIACFGRLLREESAARDLRLVLVGYAPTDKRAILESLIASENLQKQIVLTGYVEDSDLAPLYAGALAFVFPSLAEGFGLPPLEAMQCGTPVICSNRTSLPEVVGDAGLLVDPEDDDALCQALSRVCHEESLRAELSRRGLARAAQFSWQRCAADHLRAYRAAVKLKHG